MPTTQKTGIPPCGIISWTTFGLLTAIEANEHLILNQTQRNDLAALLQECALVLLGTSQRFRMTPTQAKALSHIQSNQPKKLSQN
jgi:hypothetical protein